jgi:hypothetical protein
MRFKLHEREEESPDERHGHQDFGVREIRNHDDRRSGISMVKILESIWVIHLLRHVAEIKNLLATRVLS